MEIFGQTIDLVLENQDIAARVGAFLIKEGSIRSSDLQRALDVQIQERRDANQPVGVLLTKYTALQAEQFDDLLQHR